MRSVSRLVAETPRRRTRWTPVAIGIAALLAAGCTLTRIGTSAQLARQSEPFQATPATPAKRLLVVGDSTAVGTGASLPARSVAGLVSRDHADWAVTNLAADGAKFDRIADQLPEPSAGRYDLVLVMGGGNDVIRLTSESKLERDVRRAAERARRLAPVVVLMPAGNVGNAPFFWPPVSAWMSARARTLHRIVRGTAAATGSVYVNLYQDRESDPFARKPDRFHAADGLHPSDAGYALWYRELTRQAASVFGERSDDIAPAEAASVMSVSLLDHAGEPVALPER